MKIPKQDLGSKVTTKNTKITFPKQHQNIHPGIESQMEPKPVYDNPNYVATDKLKDKIAIVTGGDSGIGRAVSILFAKEGANIAIVYLDEDQDANDTKNIIDGLGKKCTLIKSDLKDQKSCEGVIDTVVKEYGHIDILVNNAGVQYAQNSIENITKEQLQKTFETNIFSMFYLTQTALKHMNKNSKIINTTSITAYEGSKDLIDYSATKGAIVTFTRSLALSLLCMNIRVNAVAPGPVWTPLIPSSFSEQKVETFGSNNPMKRAAQPVEVAPAYLYLASDDSSYVTGQIIHVDGGGSTSS